jgi:SAM-dependent methyltransferase
MTSGEPWFVEAFRSEYVDVYAHRDLSASRREAEYLRAQSLESPVLDLCCGFGRHTLAMRQLGLDAFGIDLSAELLRHAHKLPNAQEIVGRLARGDARDLPLDDASCGAVVVLFSSFGYFGDDGDQRVLREVERVLRAGGRVVLDLMNAERVQATLVPHSRAERAGWSIEEQRRLVAGGRHVVKDVKLTRGDGTVRTWREDVRLYSPREIEALLAEAGLPLLRIDGDFDGRAWDAESPRLIVHAHKRATAR